MKQISSRKQLIEAKPKLERGFIALVELAIKSKEYQLKNDPKREKYQFQDNLYGQELKDAILRLTALPGGKEILRECQKKALIKLSDFDKKISDKSLV